MTKKVIVMGVSTPGGNVLGPSPATSPPVRTVMTLLGPMPARTVTNGLQAASVGLAPPAGAGLPTRDDVTAAVRKLSERAAGWGRESGVSYRLELNPGPQTDPRDGVGILAVAAVADVLRAKYADRCSIAVEEQRGTWGMFFTRVPAAVSSEATKTVPLSDAPFEVREWFLGQSEAFLDAYWARCEPVLLARQHALNVAGRVLARPDPLAALRRR